MAKASPIQTSFNAGELSPEVGGRVDIAKYQAGCSRLENMIPTVQGPAKRRGGTKYAAEVKDSSEYTWLSKFQFNATQAYVLEFGDQYLRFFTDNGTLLAGSPSAWAGSTAYVIGDLVAESSVNYYCIVAHTSSGSFATDAANWYAMPSSGVFEMPTPYALADLANDDGGFSLSTAQSGDVLYICHPEYAPRKLQRLSATGWVLSEVSVEGGPFDDYDPDQAITLYAGAQTGNTTLTASASTFAATDVGRLVYLEQKKANSVAKWETAKSISTNDLRRYDGKTYKATSTATTGAIPPTHTIGSELDGDTGVAWEFQDPGYGWVEITAYNSATSVDVTVLSSLPSLVVGSGNATTRWSMGSWGSVPGYPSHVTFFRNRLTFARALDRKLWFSVAGDFENFRDRDAGGLVTEDMAISITVETGEANQIQYLIPAEALIIGSAGGEHACREQTDADPFGPSNIRIDKFSSYGSREVEPVQIGDSILFVQRSGRRLREIIYDALSVKYVSFDMSILATHLVPKGKYIRQMTYQKEPNSVLWCILSDGALRGFTFNREQFSDPPFGGWHRHTIGGSGVVESIVTVPSPDNSRDDLWMIVKRTINGGTKRYVEFMQPEYETGDDQEDAFYVDSGLTYDSTATTSITGLNHLEGETIDILADGATHPQLDVSSGGVTLQNSSSVVQAGLPCPCKVATMRIEAGAADGTAQGKTKRINRVAVRLLNTLGGKMGPSETELDTILFRTGSDPMDSAPPIFSGDKEVIWQGGYDKDGYIWYVNDQPLPATVVCFMPQVTTQDR